MWENISIKIYYEKKRSKQYVKYPCWTMWAIKVTAFKKKKNPAMSGRNSKEKGCKYTKQHSQDGKRQGILKVQRSPKQKIYIV